MIKVFEFIKTINVLATTYETVIMRERDLVLEIISLNL